MAEAKRDQNYIPTLLAVSNADGVTPVVLWADPSTHRLLVTATAGGLNDLSDVTITAPAQGDILYRGATVWVNLAPGTSGKFLKTQGAAANPIWDTPSLTAGGSDTQVQFNDGGTSLGGDAGMVYAKASNTLTVDVVKLNNTGLKIEDTNASHHLTIAPGSDLSADRTLSFVTGDASRALTLTADSSIGGTAYVVSGTDVAVADGGTNLSAVAAGSILGANAGDTIIAITSGAGLKLLQNDGGTITWETVTGTGSPVLATTPTLVTPVLGAATATSINKVALSAPASASTLTIADGKTLTANSSIVLAGTDAKTLTLSDDTTIAIDSITFAGTEVLTLTATKSVTFADVFITSGANSLTLTTTGATNVTLPTTGTLSAIAGTETLTNKRVTPRVSTEASAAEPTIDTDAVDAHSITALATAVTSMTTNLSGTPTNFQKLIVRFLDNATGRAITWGASFQAMGVDLPTTTTASKVLTVGFIYDTADSKWGCVASADEA